MKIAFIDTFGLCYDGTTLTKRGLGGSESAVILCSRELAKIGFDVTVFNDCIHDDTQPGIYDGVLYRPLSEVETTTDNYDVIIGSRSIAAFAPAYMRERFKTFSYMPDFTNIQHRARHKVLWMHDTFCDGDDLIDVFLLDGLINEVFVLSDFHMDYVTNCDHGKKRMFEVMKKYMYVTRNGMTKYHDWVDITKKDPNHFVYNASVTKGMRPLVNKIWPRIRELLPDAKLTVIGGYYRMRDDHEPDAQELEWRQMVDNNPDINFTGIIKQSEIADILCDASYMIYPAEFPETFGISTLESLAYNTPLITCDFGALEETAFDAACYKIPYPIVPNGLFPYVNEDEQVERFVNLVVKAYNDKYLHQQKMYACNAVKDICGWDSVAMQWKQHFFHKLGEFLPVEDYRKAQEINYKVRKTFGRRFLNQEELQPPCNIQKEIGIITAVYNAENYIEKCILSVAQQNYKWYTMYIVDDASTDNTVSVARRTIDSLPQEIRHNFVLILNDENVGAVANHYKVINEYMGEEDFFMILDGDDWLVNNPNIFHYYNNLYHEGAEFTYGSCWSLADNIPLIAQEYPPQVKANKAYREHKFNWNMPYTHLRTFHCKLLRGLKETDLLVDGEWPKAGGDTALFYYLIEAAEPEKVICITDIVYVYNDKNPLNDYKINGDEQTNTAKQILEKTKNKVAPKFSVTIPSMWRCLDLTKRLLVHLTEHPLVGEIHLIDNDKERTPDWELLKHPKINHLIQEQNIGVNPAWTLGASLSKYDFLAILNDDIVFDPKLFDKLAEQLSPKVGAYGIINGWAEMNQPVTTDGSIDFLKWSPGMIIHCFGQAFFMHKNNWPKIPEGLIINYGDSVVFHHQLVNHRNNYLIYNINFETKRSSTVQDNTIPLLAAYDAEKENAIYFDWEVNNPIKPKSKSKFSVVVPTMWKYEPFKDFLNKLLECEDVGEVILIDNEPTKTPLELKCHIKLRYKTFGTNIYVNPAWNYGVENASYDYVCILNDDMKFDLDVFNGLRRVLDDPNTGVCGIIPGIEQYNQIPVTDGNYQIISWQEGMHQFGFGCLMFVNKNNWTHIPDDLKIYYGDYFIFDKHLASGRTNYCIVNLKHETPYAQTCSDMYSKDAEKMAQLQAREGEIYEAVKCDIWSTTQ